MEEIYKKIWELAKPFLDTRHNQQHTEIAYRAALRLLESEEGDEAIVIPAIILHDVGWIKVPEELQLTAFGPKARNKKLNRVHEVEGVKLARGILEKVNYDPQKMDEILVIIDGHDSRREAISPSDKIVKDADKLCRFTHQGTSLNCQRYEMSFDEWYEFLMARIDRWFFTQTARKIAREELERRKEEFS
jgi:HD superfamily phosphodiesterase